MAVTSTGSEPPTPAPPSRGWLVSAVALALGAGCVGAVAAGVLAAVVFFAVTTTVNEAYAVLLLLVGLASAVAGAVVLGLWVAARQLRPLGVPSAWAAFALPYLVLWVAAGAFLWMPPVWSTVGAAALALCWLAPMRAVGAVRTRTLVAVVLVTVLVVGTAAAAWWSGPGNPYP